MIDTADILINAALDRLGKGDDESVAKLLRAAHVLLALELKARQAQCTGR